MNVSENWNKDYSKFEKISRKMTMGLAAMAANYRKSKMMLCQRAGNYSKYKIKKKNKIRNSNNYLLTLLKLMLNNRRQSPFEKLIMCQSLNRKNVQSTITEWTPREFREASEEHELSWLKNKSKIRFAVVIFAGEWKYMKAIRF